MKAKSSSTLVEPHLSFPELFAIASLWNSDQVQLEQSEVESLSILLCSYAEDVLTDGQSLQVAGTEVAKSERRVVSVRYSSGVTYSLTRDPGAA
ncbi:MAG TPA: hypothetical protein V6C97_19545 [Oculatellaceae cyanobacterium]